MDSPIVKPLPATEIAEATIAGMFDRISKRYDLLNHLLSFNVDRLWRRQMIKAIPPTCRDLLDVATGTGDVLLAAGRTLPHLRSMTGVDISPGMLAIGKTKIRAAGFSGKSQMSIMSASALDLPDASFDAVTIAFGLRNVVDKRHALQEFQRVLRPGGKLLILEFFTPKNTWLAKAFLFYFRSVLPRIGGLVSDRSAYTYLPKSVESFYDERELNAELVRAGLQPGKHKQFLFGACRLVEADKI